MDLINLRLYVFFLFLISFIDATLKVFSPLELIQRFSGNGSSQIYTYFLVKHKYWQHCIFLCLFFLLSYRRYQKLLHDFIHLFMAISHVKRSRSYNDDKRLVFKNEYFIAAIATRIINFIILIRNGIGFVPK